MTILSSLLIFAQKKNLGVKLNYAEGLQVKLEGKESEQQAEYSRTDIENMFRELAKVRRPVQPERFWIPLLALYSGARMNELCQLHVDDVIEKDGVHCISITASTDDKATKNRQSERTVPIHPALVKLGFLKHVDAMRKGKHERLWSNLEFKRGNYKEDFGKWFNRTLQNKFIAEGEKKSFHSLRHSFINYFVQRIEKVPLHILKSLVGHLDDGKGKDITLSRYGKELEPKVLLKTLKMLDYGVDFGLLEKPGR
jgi:integrase